MHSAIRRSEQGLWVPRSFGNAAKFYGPIALHDALPRSNCPCRPPLPHKAIHFRRRNLHLHSHSSTIQDTLLVIRWTNLALALASIATCLLSNGLLYACKLSCAFFVEQNWRKIGTCRGRQSKLLAFSISTQHIPAEDASEDAVRMARRSHLLRKTRSSKAILSKKVIININLANFF
jgi:hypothetical protein